MALRESRRMADPYPRSSRPLKPRASARRKGRPDRATGQDDTRAGTQTQAVTRPPLPRRTRIGIVIALMAIGGTVVLAGGALTNQAPLSSGSPHPVASGQPGRSTRPSNGTSVPDAAPLIGAPNAAVTKVTSWTARITIPKLSIRRHDLRLRIYLNGKQIRDLAIRTGSTMTVRNIALRRGENTITAAVAGPGGVGPISLPVTITVDRVAPGIKVGAPADGAVINSPSAEVRGITEAHAAVTVSNASNHARSTATAAADGTFQTTIELGPGRNNLTITAVDIAGNAARSTRTVVRGTGRADAQLTLSRDAFKLRRLPASLDVHLTVSDSDGVAADGVRVTFSLSPPGQPTSTYQTNTQHGSASWLGITLTRDAIEAGTGFVTALVTLADGTVLRDTIHFDIR
jgi:hypothetical protein